MDTLNNDNEMNDFNDSEKRYREVVTLENMRSYEQYPPKAFVKMLIHELLLEDITVAEGLKKISRDPAMKPNSTSPLDELDHLDLSNIEDDNIRYWLLYILRATSRIRHLLFIARDFIEESKLFKDD